MMRLDESSNFVHDTQPKRAALSYKFDKMDSLFIQKFIEHLIHQGYPAEAIFTNLKIGDFIADLAIVDPKTNYPIAIFEFKSKVGRSLLESQIDNAKLKVKSKLIGDMHYYYVFFNKGKEFEIFSGTDQEHLILNLPKFSDLKRIPSNLRETRKRSKLDFFIIWVIVCIFISFAFLIWDIWDPIKNLITHERIILWLIIINLPFLPYWTEFGFGDLKVKKNGKVY